MPLSPFAGGGTYRPEAVLQDSVGTLKPSPPAPMSNAAAAAFESASASASAGLPRCVRLALDPKPYTAAAVFRPGNKPAGVSGRR